MANCLVTHQTTQIQGGAIWLNDSNFEMLGCTVAENSSGGIKADPLTTLLVTNSILWNVGGEVIGSGTIAVTYSCLQSGYPGEGNIDAPPEFVDSANGDFRLADGASCIDRGTNLDTLDRDLDGNPRPGGDQLTDMGAYESPDGFVPGEAFVQPTIRYVDSNALGTDTGESWENAFNRISDALRVSNASDEIRVRNGRYEENLFLEPRVSLIGGFFDPASTGLGGEPNETIIDASVPGAPSVALADNCVLKNLTIMNGETERGGGVYGEDLHATLSDCTIRDNTAEDGGGLHLVRCAINLERCVIENNYAEDDGGGIFYTEPRPSIFSDCRIAKNQAHDGAGVYGPHEDPNPVVLSGCEISENKTFPVPSPFGTSTGSSAAVRGNSTLIGCTLMGNESLGRFSEGSAGGLNFGKAKFLNCLIAENRAVSSLFFGSTLIHCTVVKNHSYWSILEDASATNSILWNFGTEILGDSTATYCCIQSGYPGTGNIDYYPEFMDYAGDDFRLRNGSPCVDTGLPEEAPDTDLEGRSRPGLDGLVDIGAYESIDSFTPTFPSTEEKTLFVRASAPVGGTGESWETAFRSLQAALVIARPSDEIWVAAGLYDVPVDIEPGLRVYGGFAGTETHRTERDPVENLTVIEDEARGRMVLLTDATVLDGFSIGGSLVVGPHSTATIRDCSIFGYPRNEPFDLNGGVYCEEASTVLLERCDISSHPDSGVLCMESTMTLLTCSIRDNDYGVYVLDNSETLMAIRMDNCLVLDSDYSGVRGSSVLRNCTVDGGDFSINTSESRKIEVMNSILADGIKEVYRPGGALPDKIAFSYVQGSHPASDPGFADPESGDYTLALDSPLIDAGNPEEEFNDACLPPGLGTERGDMGAYGGPLNCNWADYNPPPTTTPRPTHTFTPTATPTLRGDFNGDRWIDANDLLRMIRRWQVGVSTGTGEDLYPDSIIGGKDLLVFQELWHSTTGP
ncbi:MAG: right-handed parallel beta-helix repeat-containing protein [Candidatus Omnitrophica bacterium]|nr:right-handed parallel beta-helix repeat-containing protein [Candidatus Omnitrophota bacterium]